MSFRTNPESGWVLPPGAGGSSSLTRLHVRYDPATGDYVFGTRSRPPSARAARLRASGGDYVVEAGEPVRGDLRIASRESEIIVY